MAWQHPSLPWVDLIHRGPRIASRDSSNNVPSISANPLFRESLFTHWIDSFRSLFQVKYKIHYVDLWNICFYHISIIIYYIILSNFSLT